MQSAALLPIIAVFLLHYHTAQRGLLERPPFPAPLGKNQVLATHRKISTLREQQGITSKTGSFQHPRFKMRASNPYWKKKKKRQEKIHSTAIENKLCKLQAVKSSTVCPRQCFLDASSPLDRANAGQGFKICASGVTCQYSRPAAIRQALNHASRKVGNSDELFSLLSKACPFTFLFMHLHVNVANMSCDQSGKVQLLPHAVLFF